MQYYFINAVLFYHDAMRFIAELTNQLSALVFPSLHVFGGRIVTLSFTGTSSRGYRPLLPIHVLDKRILVRVVDPTLPRIPRGDLRDAQVGSGPAITFNDAIVVGDESFEITFINPMDNTEIYAAVISNSPCTEDNSLDEVDSDTPYAAFGQSSVTVLQSINELITAQDKNQGSVQLNFCLRADVRAPSFEYGLLNNVNNNLINSS
jgi:hypothetical protein